MFFAHWWGTQGAHNRAVGLGALGDGSHGRDDQLSPIRLLHDPVEQAQMLGHLGGEWLVPRGA